MKIFFSLTLLVLFSLAACDGWSYTIPTFPAPPPTITPFIYSPTPVILTITSTPEILSNTPSETATQIPPTDTATVVPELPTPTDTPTNQPNPAQLIVQVLGCNTSIDITHAMGEVTNAFVIIKNIGGVYVADLCTTLFALDEGRVHPYKTVCVPGLENDYQLTLKLTVDSTYQQETPIQVEVKSGETLLSRVDSPSCTDVGLFAPSPGYLLTPMPIQ